MSRMAWLAGSMAVAVALVLLWQLAADARWVSPVFLPSPDRAGRALVEGLAGGDLLDKLIGTVVRMILGWLLASLIGVALGAAIGISPAARVWLQPTLEFLRPLPASAIVPVAIALLGLSEGMVLAVIAFGALWPMLLGTVHGFAAVEPRLYEVARALKLSQFQIITKIALPNALPDIFAGLRLGLTVALILSVVGEMLASREGLGLWILLSARSFRAPDLFAGVILLGLIGLISAALLALAERRALRWRAPT
jgi:ABC-type nitrate/sulfonate/bicarbonate transport system permease component